MIKSIISYNNWKFTNVFSRVKITFIQICWKIFFAWKNTVISLPPIFTRSHIYLFYLDCFFVEKQILQQCYLSHLIKSPPKKLMTRQKRRIFHWWKLFLQFWLLDKSCIPVILYQWEFFGELRYVMIWFVTLNRCYFVSNISYNTLRQSKHDNVTFMQC